MLSNLFNSLRWHKPKSASVPSQTAQTLSPEQQELVDQINWLFPDACIGGDVDFSGGEFWIEITRSTTDKYRFWFVRETPKSLRYGVARFFNDGESDFNTRCDEYFATFAEGRNRLLARLQEEIESV